jgi:hypothetical protein
MSDETITIPKLTAQIVFDALVHSMDFGSGFLDTEEVQALRGLAEALGVDPATSTPDEFKRDFPHTFVGETDREQVAWMCGALTQTRAVSATGSPYTVNTVNDDALPDYAPCKVGSYGRKCLRPEADPMHQAAAT